MDIFGIPLTWTNLIYIGMFIAIVWSLFTLFDYFFGGPDPLEWNAIARIEAAQNPATLLVLREQRNRRRSLAKAVVVCILVVVLVVNAPQQASQIATAMADAAVLVVESVVAGVKAFGEALRSG